MNKVQLHIIVKITMVNLIYIKENKKKKTIIGEKDNKQFKLLTNN